MFEIQSLCFCLSPSCMYIWRWTPGNVADVSATSTGLPFTYRISTLSSRSYDVMFLPLETWRHRSDSSGAGRECWNPVRERQLWSGDVGYVTWRSPSFVHNLYCKLMIDFSYISMFQLEDQESHDLLYPSQWVGTEKKLLLRDCKSFPLFDLFASKYVVLLTVPFYIYMWFYNHCLCFI